MFRFLRGFLFITLLFSLFFTKDLMAAVLYDQSKIGVPYDILEDPGSGFGFYSKFPQYSGTGALFPGGGTAYSGTLAWLRVKRISGVACHVPNNINITTTDGSTVGFASAGMTVGDYCDFPISGPNLTNQAVGYIGICITGDCSNRPGTLILDGSPENEGYILDGTQTMQKTGGWAFQLCDSGGCSGGFEEVLATSTPTTTPATGASSVLFLPGIMGSRLYEESPECADSNGEQQRWFSTDECDQLRMKTDFTGTPLHTLYTKPEEDSVIDDIFVLSPLYEGFLGRLEEEKNDNNTIADYRAVPYDWRLTLGDILKTKKVNGKVMFDPSSSYQQSYVYQSLQELVETSHSGKVTIVAHSNGGLVAKALLLEMQAQGDPLLDKIDNLILVGVPQVGTPSAIEGLLQGNEITHGIVIDNVVSRDILNTAPFGHHLLPSAKYFDSVGTPVLQFQSGSASGLWHDEYGEGITNSEDLHRFLSRDSGRPNPDRADLSQPEVVDNFLLDYASTIHDGQASFVPPETMSVSQVAGTGISTPISLLYFTDKECVNRSVFSFFLCTEYQDKLGYSVRMASDGDGTVVVPSALAMPESEKVERVWVDLERYNVRNSDRVHRNILEVLDIQDFILNTIEATTSRQYTYLDQEEVVLETGSHLVFQLHSPLDMWVSTDSGEISSTTNEVEGALYRRIGEVQYIEVPETEEEIRLHMVGLSTGSFTLEIERWQGSTLEDRVDYVAVPTATGTRVSAEISEDIAQVRLELDQEGDGIIEGEMTTEEEFLETIVSYEDLISEINTLNLSRIRKQALLTLVKSAEYYDIKSPTKPWYLILEDGFLKTSGDLVRLYTKKRYLTIDDAEKTLMMIEVLKNKQ